MISEQGSTHRLAHLFPQQPRILPLEFNTGFWFRKFAPGFAENRHRLIALDRVDTVSSEQTQAYWLLEMDQVI